LIQVRNLYKNYGNHAALSDLSFSVEKGQIYGLLGSNGAGKSTTMNIMTGYISATSGQIIIDGHDLMQEPEEAKKCMGYLPELPPLYLDMTAREYLRFVTELKNVPREQREAEVDRVMAITSIEDVCDRQMRTLSKGYRQRVGVAQALVGDPPIIILDEPTVGLDPKQIIEMRDMIKSLGQEHTVILSSHILSEVSAVCDQVLILSKGRLAACDTPHNLARLHEGKTSLSLTVKGEEETVRTALSALPQVESLTVEEAEGLLAVTLETPHGTDIREQVFFALADARCPILRMDTASKTLEDVFLELTSSAPEAVPAPPDGETQE